MSDLQFKAAKATRPGAKPIIPKKPSSSTEAETGSSPLPPPPVQSSQRDGSQGDGSMVADLPPPPVQSSQESGSQEQYSQVSALTDGSQDMGLHSVGASADPPADPMVIAIENHLLEPIDEHADASDDTSNSTGLSVKSTDTIDSLAVSVVSFANSLADASETSFTMAPSADALLADFYVFWNEHRDIGYTAVMVAFISFAYSNSRFDRDAITGFFNRMNPGLNLRTGGATITQVISNAVNQPGKAAGGSGIMSGITNGIRAIATAVATSVAAVIGTNMVVDEPLTIDSVTTLLFELGENVVDILTTGPEFISKLTVKLAKLKALYTIKKMEIGVINDNEIRNIQIAVEEVGNVVNDASAAGRTRVPLTDDVLRSRIAAISNTLKSGAGAGPGAGAGASAGASADRGGKRQSQKQQKKKQQKKTQKQHKKLSKSKRAKKSKQSKKANKKH